jgi:hypothetical protein
MELWNWSWWNSMEFHGKFQGIPWNSVNWRNLRNLMEFGFDREGIQSA